MQKLASVWVIAVVACSGMEPSADAPPTLEITSPQRGALGEDGHVTVTGRASDDGPVRVTLAGADVEVAADGTFSSTIQVPDGITILETHAIDTTGHDVRDVRAVLSGTLAPSDGTVASKIGAHLGTQGLSAVGDAVATVAEGIDFTAAAQALNPVYDNGGCLGAKVNITSVSVGNIDVALAPKPDALDTRVALANVVVKLHADFKVACIGGSTTITVRSTTATVRDDLGALLVGGKVRTSLPSPTVTLDGFSVDVGGVPGAIEDLLRSKAREGAEKALASAIKNKVPPLADGALATLLARSLDTALLGHDLSIGVVPTNLAITDTGLAVTADATVVVAGGEGGTFVSTPMAIGSVQQDGPDLGALIADDVANQLFAGLWGAGAFDLTLAGDQVGPAAALLDDDIKTLDVKLSLPPTITTRDALELAVGDLIITGRDAAGTEVQRFSLSLRTTLSATPSGDHLVVTTTTPTVFAQVLAQSDAVDAPLEAAQLEGIVGGVWGLVNQKLDDALANLPMPTIAGMTLSTPDVSGKDGYLIVNAGLR